MKRTLMGALAGVALGAPLLAAASTDDFSHELRTNLTTMYGARFSSSPVVKGAPYSAEAITETNQPLADGNVISRRTLAGVHRDSEGRTRQETAGEGGKPGAVYINDPVESKHIVLMPAAKRAVVTPRMAAFTHDLLAKRTEKQVMRFGASEIRIEDGKVLIDGAARSMDGKETGDGTRREEVRVQVIRSPLPGVHTMHFESTARLGKGTTTVLGSKDFDGVRAEGKSTVWTIPAGEIGNRNPIQITSESWYSPDLKVTMFSRYHDPRTGESIYRLGNVRRAEPARELFTVPEGYEVKGRGKRDERR